MHELKRIHPQAIPAALEKARQYRLLNEPGEAESICRDILEVDADNAEATRTLLLAVTDQLTRNYRATSTEARELVTRLRTEYEREYYSGVIAERCAKALKAMSETDTLVVEAIREAMAHFERAIPLADDENDEATLRWNACVRLIHRYGLDQAEEAAGGVTIESFDDEVPFR